MSPNKQNVDGVVNRSDQLIKLYYQCDIWDHSLLFFARDSLLFFGFIFEG